MHVTFEWLLPTHETAAVCTDSQLLLKAIQSGSADLRRMLDKRPDKASLIKIPG